MIIAEKGKEVSISDKGVNQRKNAGRASLQDVLEIDIRHLCDLKIDITEPVFRREVRSRNGSFRSLPTPSPGGTVESANYAEDSGKNLQQGLSAGGRRQEGSLI